MEKSAVLNSDKRITCCLMILTVFFASSCSSSQELSFNFDKPQESMVFLDSRYKGYRLTDIVGSPTKTNLSDYDYDFFYDLSNGYLTVFPSEINEGELSSFIFYEEIGGRSYINRYEVFLEWTLPEATFLQELSRLRMTVYHGYDGDRLLKYSENLFIMPSYVGMYNTSSSTFEYAIVDKNSLTFRYVILHNVGDISQIAFSMDYAPTKLLKDSDLAEYATGRGLSIYYPVY